MESIEYLYIFSGDGGHMPAGAFRTFESAKKWIESENLSGVLNKVPIGISIYDYAIKNEYFQVKRPNQISPSFKQTFTSASLQHWHYDNGVEE